MDLNFNQILTSRQTNFKTSKSNTNKVGVNALMNIIFYINDQIPLNWLNLAMSTFKVKCKEKFLNY